MKNEIINDTDFRTVNLWNVTKKNNFKKTRSVLEYINSLREKETWDIAQSKLFTASIQRALRETTPDAMLEIIGYRFGKMPQLFDKIYNMKK